MVATRLKSQFFPEDVQYWSYVDVWLPNNAPLSLTNDTAAQAEADHRRVVADYEKSHPASRTHEPLLKSITTFVGGGGPRFWFSASPEQQQQNYSQVLIQLTNKEATPELVKPLQAALSNRDRRRLRCRASTADQPGRVSGRGSRIRNGRCRPERRSGRQSDICAASPARCRISCVRFPGSRWSRTIGSLKAPR